jgi:5-methylcytosine-specific restriction endonuclease McrA
VWLRSRERAAAIRREKHTCQRCHRKGSEKKGHEVKIQVHHKDGIANWDAIINLIYEQILCDPQFLEVVCVQCHDAEHSGSGHDAVMGGEPAGDAPAPPTVEPRRPVSPSTSAEFRRTS